MGKQGKRAGKMFFAWDEVSKPPGHVFYDRLQSVLMQAGFDRFVEDTCAASYGSGSGRRSIPPGRYFRMHLVGYFEGIDSGRGIEWQCADSLSLREFLLLDTGERVPDKGYHGREVLKTFAQSPWKTRIAEPEKKKPQLLAQRPRSQADSV